MKDETKLLVAAIQSLQNSVLCFRRLREMAPNAESKGQMTVILEPLEAVLEAFRDAVQDRKAQDAPLPVVPPSELN